MTEQLPTKEWIKQHYQHAVEAVGSSGVLPEVLLGQAILESQRSGKMPGSVLAREHNNYFGIKASKAWPGKSVNMKTKEYYRQSDIPAEIRDTFKVYPTVLDSFQDYVKFLQQPRYKKALQMKTAEGQAAVIHAAGYATDPNYSEKLSAVARIVSKIAEAAQLIKKHSVGAGAIILLFAAGFGLYKYSK